MTEKTGDLIVLEGIDGCGKDTQMDMLYNWLKSEGYDLIRTNEPWDEGLRPMIKEIIRESEKSDPAFIALAFAADRRLHLVNQIIPSLEAGKVILSNRYVYSSFAYHPSEGLDINWIKSINDTAILADLCLLVDIPVYEAVQRIEKSETHMNERARYEKKELLLKIRENYLKQAEEYDEMVKIDGNRPKSEVFESIKTAVQDYFSSKESADGLNE